MIIIPLQPNDFFSYQLKAFQVWLVRGLGYRKPPEQLPIVLQVIKSSLLDSNILIHPQVLLSQLHRLQALELLSKFLDLGPSAVHLVCMCIIQGFIKSHNQLLQALSVGIFPYMLKLLQSKSRELQPVLVFIWAKILAIDSVSDVYEIYIE